MVGEFKKLYIFGMGAGKDGQSTLKFEDGTVFDNTTNEDAKTLIFTYKSASTHEVIKAYFLKSNISGFSWT